MYFMTYHNTINSIQLHDNCKLHHCSIIIIIIIIIMIIIIIIIII